MVLGEGPYLASRGPWNPFVALKVKKKLNSMFIKTWLGGPKTELGVRPH